MSLEQDRNGDQGRSNHGLGPPRRQGDRDLHLAGEGWDIATHYNTSRDEALSLQAEVKAAGVDCRLYSADLSDPAAADRLAASAASPISRTRPCWSTAPRSSRRIPFANLRPALWDEHLRINALSPILLTRAFHRLLPPAALRDQHARPEGDEATPDFFSYTISKLALHNATRMMAMSLWPKTRVNGIAPGLVLRSGDQTEEQFQARAQKHAAGRRTLAGGDLPGRLDAGGHAVDHGAGRHHRRRAPPAHQVPVRRPAEGMIAEGQRAVRRSPPTWAALHRHRRSAARALHRRARVREAGAAAGLDDGLHVRAGREGRTRSDDLADYVSYADIVDRLKARAKSTRHVNLVETLAEEVAALALADAPRWQRGRRRAQDRDHPGGQERGRHHQAARADPAREGAERHERGRQRDRAGL